MTDPSSIATGSFVTAALYAVGRYIHARIRGADTAKDVRIEELEKKEQEQINELREKVEKLSADLKSLHSHVLLLEGFRTAVLMLANTAGVCISPEAIIRLSQDIDKKIQEMNA